MALEGIAEYLKKFTLFEEPNKKLRERMVVVLKELCDIELSRKNISVKNTTVTIAVPPLLKTEIALHKKAILSKLPPEFQHYQIR